MRDDDIRMHIECTQLTVAYCWALDNNDAASFAGLFTANATWQRPTGETLVGIDRILAAFNRARAGVLRHIANNATISRIGARRARGESLATVYRGTARPDAPPLLQLPIHIVQYSDTFELEADDCWRISTRDTVKLFVGN